MAPPPATATALHELSSRLSQHGYGISLDPKPLKIGRPVRQPSVSGSTPGTLSTVLAPASRENPPLFARTSPCALARPPLRAKVEWASRARWSNAPRCDSSSWRLLRKVVHLDSTAFQHSILDLRRLSPFTVLSGRIDCKWRRPVAPPWMSETSILAISRGLFFCLGNIDPARTALVGQCASS